MRILSGAIGISAALFTSTLCEEHIHANYHNKRALSDLLNELATAEPLGKNGALESQLQAIRTGDGGSLPTGDGVAIYTLGNGANPTSLPINKGAIWVSISPTGLEVIPSPGAAQAAPTSGGTENLAQPSPSPLEPSTSPSKGNTTSGEVAMPISSPSTTTMTETKTIWSTVVMGLPTGVAPPAAIVPGVLPPSPVREGLTRGTGVIENGACNCACNCPASAFPGALQPALPAPVSATTLSTVILPPTAPVVLPSTLLIDTKLPPNGALATAPIANPVATLPSAAAPAPVIPAPAPAISAISSVPAAIPTTTSSTSVPTITSSTSTVPIPTQPLPVVAPPIPVPTAPPAVSTPTTSASLGPESSLQLGLASGVPPLPTAVAELAPAEEKSINISTFSLVSTLVLGPLGAV